MLKALIVADDRTNASAVTALTDIVEEGRLFDTLTGDPEEVLSDLDSAMDYDLFVVCGSLPPLSEDAHANLGQSLYGGAGLLVVHGAPAAPEPLSIHYLDHYHPVARGLRDFQVNASPPGPSATPFGGAILVVANATPLDGGDAAPVMVSSSHGRGRIFHSLIGGFDTAGYSPLLDSDPLRRALARATEWAATGNVLDF